jgi:hypothetical protein
MASHLCAKNCATVPHDRCVGWTLGVIRGGIVQKDSYACCLKSYVSGIDSNADAVRVREIVRLNWRI